MRSPMVWSHLPPGLTDPGGAAKKIKRAKSKCLPTEKDVARVRSYAAHVRPEVLHAFVNAFIGRDLSSFTNVFDSNETLIFPREGYFYQVLRKGKMEVAVLFLNGNVLAQGGTAQLFLFASNFHPHACPVICSEARKYQEGSGYVKGMVAEELEEVLEDYRRTRKAAEGLDSISKKQQLDFIEQDSTYLKFKGCVFEGNPIHYGSGPFGASIMASEAPVLCVDPLVIQEGSGYDTFVKELPVVPDGGTIFCDASVGDAGGLVYGTEVKKLHHQLSEKADKVPVYIKMDLTSKTGPPGYPFYKARPHNSEIIWEVDNGGDAWGDRVPSLRKKARDANSTRMKNMFDPPYQAIKPHVLDVYEIRDFFLRPFRLPVPRQKAHYKHPDRFEDRLRSLPIKKFNIRQSLWAKGLEKFSIDDYHLLCQAYNRGTALFCKLPPTRVRRGSALDQDPMVGPVKFSIHSLFLSARHREFECYKTGDGWQFLYPRSRLLS